MDFSNVLNILYVGAVTHFRSIFNARSSSNLHKGIGTIYRVHNPEYATSDKS